MFVKGCTAILYFKERGVSLTCRYTRRCCFLNSTRGGALNLFIYLFRCCPYIIPCKIV